MSKFGRGRQDNNCLEVTLNFLKKYPPSCNGKNFGLGGLIGLIMEFDDNFYSFSKDLLRLFYDRRRIPEAFNVKVLVYNEKNRMDIAASVKCDICYTFYLTV